VLLRTTGQLAQLPAVEARGAERRRVNLAADLREPGSSMVDVEVADLSTEGFMVRGGFALEIEATVWLKLAGFAPMRSEVVWIEDGKAGCKFAEPLYSAELEMIIESQPKSGQKRLFTPPTRRIDEPDSQAA
jgi:hypothetical protein